MMKNAMYGLPTFPCCALVMPSFHRELADSVSWIRIFLLVLLCVRCALWDYRTIEGFSRCLKKGSVVYLTLSLVQFFQFNALHSATLYNCYVIYRLST